ncbi:terminase large subunit [Eubacterium sp. TM05-53]|nr:terminase large subunit [Eubacterium sp. TM05-53]
MKYLELYKKQIKEGKAVVGKWIQLNIEYIENGLKEGRFFYNDKKADEAIVFIERFCHHVEGKTSLIKLEPWQKYFLSCVFGIVDSNGNRQFREIVLIMGRKQGKSLLAGAIEVKIAFTEREAGMQIYNLAPKLEQAHIIFNVAYNMIDRVPSLAKRMRKRRADMYFPSWNCTLKPIAFNSKKSDGFNPSAVTYDEFAAWEGDRGLAMYNVMLSAQGARKQPLNIACSTANYIDDGLYDELMARSTSVLLGTSEETRLLPFIYMVDDVKKWDDMNELKKAMPNLGVSVSYEFIEEEIRKAKGSHDYKLEFMTKYCNVKQNSISAWLSSQEIKKTICEKLDPEDFRGCYGVGGIDLSRTTDLTAASIVIRKNGLDYVLTQFFMPENKIDELSDRDHIRYRKFVDLGFLTPSGQNFVRYEDVADWFKMMRDKYEIVCCVVGYDRYSSQYLVDKMQNDGYPMDDVIQGTNLTSIINEFGGLLRDGVVRTGTNGLLQSHFASVALKKVTNDNRVRPEKVEQRKHIDGFVSVIDAYTVRAKWYEKYKWLLDSNDDD